MTTLRKLFIVLQLTAVFTASAQEYHGEMERLYPDKTTSTTAKKPTATAKKTAPATKRIAMSELPSTINPKLQELAESLLKGYKGSIVAIEPSTGEVLCLATNSPTGADPKLAIATAYAPGSTFKVAQALTLMSEGIVNQTMKVACHGAYTDGKLRVGCHKHPSPLPLSYALAYSCNTWFLKGFNAMIGNIQKYGTKEKAIDTWRNYMVSMGLGGPTGIDMEGEKGGLVANSAYLSRRYANGWTPRTIIWAGMGQGDITATPLQLCVLATSVANRGYFYTPHTHRGTPDNPLPERFTTKRQTAVAPWVYPFVVQGMRNAVLKGTASSLNTPAYSICGKTGTVENTGKDHSAFIGFAPMNNPKIAIAVFIENAGFGADVAAPMAGKIIKSRMALQ